MSSTTPEDTATATTPGDTTRTSVARTVTDVLQPRNALLAGMLGLGLAAAGDWTGLLWGSSGRSAPG